MALRTETNKGGPGWFLCRVFAVLALTLLSDIFARAQSTDKVLYNFSGGNDGSYLTVLGGYCRSGR